MSYMRGDLAGVMLLDALGLPRKNVTRIVIDCSAGSLATVIVTHVLTEQQAAAVACNLKRITLRKAIDSYMLEEADGTESGEESGEPSSEA